MFDEMNEILVEATPVRETHNKLCMSPAMFYLSALQYLGAMEFTYEHEELETVAVHLSDVDTCEDNDAWIEEIENIARATYLAHNERAQTYTFPRAVRYTQKFVRNGVPVPAYDQSWVKWEFQVY